jgi:hypothetical protein
MNKKEYLCFYHACLCAFLRTCFWVVWYLQIERVPVAYTDRESKTDVEKEVRTHREVERQSDRARERDEVFKKRAVSRYTAAPSVWVVYEALREIETLVYEALREIETLVYEALRYPAIQQLLVYEALREIETRAATRVWGLKRLEQERGI